MTLRLPVMIIVVALVMTSGILLIDDSDAETLDQGTFYVYGDNPIMMPTFPESESTWTAICGDTELEVTPYGNGGSVTIDISDVDGTVRVEQAVGEDVAVSYLIPLHLPSSGDDDGVYTITFHDGNNVVEVSTITNQTVVEMGDIHVAQPEDPEREGYEFGGWFTDRSFVANSEFDPRQPITGDMDVYAKWTSVSTPGGDSGRVDVENHVVTFQCDTGLTYNLLTNTGGVITFEVLEESGYDVVWSTVEVTADYCDVSYLNGVYTLSGINSDVIVQITGEVVTSDNPNAPSDDGGTDYTLYAIFLIILAIICIALAVYIMRTRGSRV